jgi:arginyl-tRNA synthetase
MPDPATVLTARLEAAITAAFGPELAGTDPVLRRSDHADFQANAAMALGKQLGHKPRDIAARIVEHLDASDIVVEPVIAGPGFINLQFRSDYLAHALEAEALDSRLGVPEVVNGEPTMVEYSAPNVAKEMHVGHLRSSVIGDALARTLAFAGYPVLRQNHLGDWGTQFGMLIEHLVDLGWAEPGHDHTIADLNALYQEAQGKFAADDDFKTRARERVVALQSGDDTTLALWQELTDESKRHFERVYAKLGVLLTAADIRGESFYNDELAATVAELESKDLVTLNDGALCAFPPGFSNRDGEPLPLIVRKSDGGYGYASTDLAAIRFRTQVLGLARLVYVVDARQSQHFAMVFAIAQQAGWLVDARAEHVAFGTVLGSDGKPFKTRSGETVKLVDLLDEGIERAAAFVADKGPDLDAETRAAVARAVGIGAIKYADLASDRVKDYVFDWDRLLAMDGNTAPYLQYAHARIRSILRRAAAGGFGPGPIHIEAPQERALALALVAFSDTVAQVVETLQPHRLCTYLFDLASTFSGFYEHCPVLRADTDKQRASRIALADLTARVIAQGLDLLGIEAPQQM